MKKNIEDLVDLWKSRSDVSEYSQKEQIEKIRHYHTLLTDLIDCTVKIKDAINKYKRFNKYHPEPEDWTASDQLSKIVLLSVR